MIPSLCQVHCSEGSHIAPMYFIPARTLWGSESPPNFADKRKAERLTDGHAPRTWYNRNANLNDLTTRGLFYLLHYFLGFLWILLLPLYTVALSSSSTN